MSSSKQHCDDYSNACICLVAEAIIDAQIVNAR